MYSYIVMDVTILRMELSTALDTVEDGKTIAVERRGRTIALLSPVKPPRPRVDLMEIQKVCEKYGLQCLHLFGSIWTDSFGPNSDVDIIYTEGERKLRFKDECNLEDDLSNIFGRKIDLVSRQVVESTNRFLKTSILEGSRLVYGQ
jgi:predicted nucleotidyltransferase